MQEYSIRHTTYALVKSRKPNVDQRCAAGSINLVTTKYQNEERTASISSIDASCDATEIIRGLSPDTDCSGRKVSFSTAPIKVFFFFS